MVLMGPYYYYFLTVFASISQNNAAIVDVIYNTGLNLEYLHTSSSDNAFGMNLGLELSIGTDQFDAGGLTLQETIKSDRTILREKCYIFERPLCYQTDVSALLEIISEEPFAKVDVNETLVECPNVHDFCYGRITVSKLNYKVFGLVNQTLYFVNLQKGCGSGSKGCWTSDISENDVIDPQVLRKFGVNNETVEILAPVLANTHPKAQTETCVINPCEDFLSSEKSNSVILGGKEKCLTAMIKLIALVILLYVASQ